MTRTHSLCLALLAAVCFAGQVSLHASGSYCACLPKPPTTTGSAKVTGDRDQYDLGQKIFNGKIRTAQVQEDALAQRTRLQVLQAQLPPRVAKKKDLTRLAGKLTDDQLEGLEYFVARRYPASR